MNNLVGRGLAGSADGVGGKVRLFPGAVERESVGYLRLSA